MHTYIVTHYRPSDRKQHGATPRAYIETSEEVDALNAAAALVASGQVGHTGQGGLPITRRFQNHENEAVRDNAHYQRTSTGTIGSYAIRKDAIEIVAALEKRRA